MGVGASGARVVVAGLVAVATVAAFGQADAVSGERAPKPSTLRMSVSSTEAEGNGSSGAAAVSGDCSLVAFASAASNLVPNDTKKFVDVLARDRDTGKTVLVSKAPGTARANGDSRPNSVSKTGRFVAYDSGASNLVPGDTNGWYDVFVRDLMRKRSELISVAADGGPADSTSIYPSISANGRFVSFNSDAENLVDEPTMNDIDVYLRDRKLGTTEVVSKGFGGALPDTGSGPSEISGNGRYILYNSAATNLVEGGDGDALMDAYRYDRVTGETILVSEGQDGAVTDDAPVSGDDISFDGRYVSLTTYSDKMIEGLDTPEANVYWRDLETGEVKIVSVSSEGDVGDSFAFYSSISDDGEVVTFDSQSNGLVPGDDNFMVDIYAHYVDSGVTTRATVSTAGRGAARGGSASAGSANGACVAFASGSPKLVPDDHNGLVDVILRNLGPRPPAT